MRLPRTILRSVPVCHGRVRLDAKVSQDIRTDPRTDGSKDMLSQRVASSRLKNGFDNLYNLKLTYD